MSHFLNLNYRGINLNFLRLAQLLIDGDVESNSRLIQKDYKCPRACPKKIKVFKGTQKSSILVRAVILMLLVLRRYKMISSIQYKLSA